jgi:FkbM family methyltransferase
MNSNSYADAYLSYVQEKSGELSEQKLALVKTLLENTNWDEPQSFLDLNNCAVIALIEAEKTEDIETRQLYLETAISLLNDGIQHPLCTAHLVLIQHLLGESSSATQLAFSTFINNLHLAFTRTEIDALGLIYLPPELRELPNDRHSSLLQILIPDQDNAQFILLLGEALQRSQPIFYNPTSFRLLQIAIQLLPNSVPLNLKLGISSLTNGRGEGLFYLHRAVQLAPDYAANLQALYLAYRDSNQLEKANFWLNTARQIYNDSPTLDWQWATLEIDNPITYVLFNQTQLLAVEASLRSIVTLVLVGSGQWFESEMEFWYEFLQPGMTVIDVGANVGVYTFSAAEKVGASGKVLAVEPFSGCVRCLEETCKINQIHWVKVCAGAASDRPGTAKLSLHPSSELNEILIEENATANSENYEEVKCFTLDSLIDTENLQHIDFLKIDAENHEMAVLLGSRRILTDFKPIILYENIAGNKGANLPVAEFLQNNGYKLFCFQPYVKKLEPVQSMDELKNRLNVIAIPQEKAANPLNE